MPYEQYRLIVIHIVDVIGQATTYNNFACYYRRKGKLHSALQYLQKVSALVNYVFMHVYTRAYKYEHISMYI